MNRYQKFSFSTSCLGKAFVFYWIFVFPLQVMAESPEKSNSCVYMKMLDDKFDFESGSLNLRFKLDYSFGKSLIQGSAYNGKTFTLLGIGKFNSVDMKYFDESTIFNPNAEFIQISLRQNWDKDFLIFETNTYTENKKGETLDKGGLAVFGNKEKDFWLDDQKTYSLDITWKVTNKEYHIEIFLDGKSVGRRRLSKKNTSLIENKDRFMYIGGFNMSRATIYSYKLLHQDKILFEFNPEHATKAVVAKTFIPKSLDPKNLKKGIINGDFKIDKNSVQFFRNSLKKN